jgi:protein-histidine pros-kinase
MGLRVKFNLVLLLVFLLGLGASGWISHGLLQRNAREDVLRTAGVMMEAAASMRAYTVGQVRPHLRQVEGEFLPQSVPAYSATEILGQLRKAYPDYAYKEAALNPTNPRNRAVEWETDVVNAFRGNEALTEFVGVRATPTGQSLYLARPFRIKDAACLACHTTPETAPAAMVKLYGPGNGFGWKLNEVVGAQIVSVPMALPVRNANRAFATFMASLAGVFALLFVILNVMLTILVLRPIAGMSATADRISTGELDLPDLPETGSDEVSVLAKSINRMHRSLSKAIRMIDES